MPCRPGAHCLTLAAGPPSRVRALLGAAGALALPWLARSALAGTARSIGTTSPAAARAHHRGRARGLPSDAEL